MGKPENTEQSRVEYLSKAKSIAFDFAKHFEIYEKASDLFEENEKDIFNKNKASWSHFFSSYSELVSLLQEFGFKPALIENSLFIAQKEDPNEPEYLLVVFNQHEDMLKQYVHGVKKNVLGKKVGNKQFNSITHHKELATNPYYYKRYPSNTLANLAISTNLRNIEYSIKSYKRKPFEEKGIGELVKVIENFFDEVMSDYVTLQGSSKANSSHTSDLAILIPFPRPGTSFLRHVNLAGGCFFLFGSMDNNKSVEKLIARVRQYIVDSLLQQTMLKSTIEASNIKSEEKIVHFFKSSINRNFIQKLTDAQAHATGESRKHVKQALAYSYNLLEKANLFLKALHISYEYIDHTECKTIIKDCIKDFDVDDVSISMNYNYSGGKIYTHPTALNIVITMIIDNAIKYMDKFWRSNSSKGMKKIRIRVDKTLVGNQSAFEVSIFNNGTEVNEDSKAYMGKYAPTGLSGGSTGWGFIIIYEALQKMDAYNFHEINNFLKVDNIKLGKLKGVDVCFRLRTNN